MRDTEKTICDNCNKTFASHYYGGYCFDNSSTNPNEKFKAKCTCGLTQSK